MLKATISPEVAYRYRAGSKNSIVIDCPLSIEATDSQPLTFERVQKLLIAVTEYQLLSNYKNHLYERNIKNLRTEDKENCHPLHHTAFAYEREIQERANRAFDKLKKICHSNHVSINIMHS